MPKRNLADLFELVTDAVPEREALVCGARRLTYAQLDERANRLAHHLAAAGVGPGDHVAACLYNSTEYVETMLAAFKLRASAVNVNWRYVADELHYVLDDADAKAIVYDPRFDALSEVRPRLSKLPTWIPVGPEYESVLAASSPGRGFGPRSADDLYTLYTGGTTGMPKGVLWRHDDFLAASLGNLDGAVTAEEVTERARRGRDRTLPACPLMHGAAQWVSLATFLAGNTVVYQDFGQDPRALVRLMAAERITVLAIVGDAVGRPLAQALMERAGPDSPPTPRSADQLDLSTCRVVLTSGAFLSPDTKDTLLACLPGTFIYDTYGASESGSFARSVSGAGETPDQGRFSVGETSAVLDDDHKPVAPGSGGVGRVARSGHVALGYYGDPETTAATFPVIDGVRWVVTGDHATVEPGPDGTGGTIRLLGRGSACINTGGEKVYPDEVEAALKSHPGVADAMVVGVPDERFGERVVALVVPAPGVAAEGEVPPDLDAHVRKRVAGYKAPRTVLVTQEIERFPSGKPDYAWGRARAFELLGPDAGG